MAAVVALAALIPNAPAPVVGDREFDEVGRASGLNSNVYGLMLCGAIDSRMGVLDRIRRRFANSKQKVRFGRVVNRGGLEPDPKGGPNLAERSGLGDERQIQLCW